MHQLHLQTCCSVFPDTIVLRWWTSSDRASAIAGGVQVAGQEYIEPSYRRVPVHHDLFQELLDDWAKTLQTSATVRADCNQQAHGTETKDATAAPASAYLVKAPPPQIITVDILIPSFRASPDRLAQLFSASKYVDGANCKFLVQIDNPIVSKETQTWLDAQQGLMLNRLKVRRNERNMGAGLTRNRLLDDSHAEYIIMFDDDVVPTAKTIQAYIQAFEAYPTAAAFAGMSLDFIFRQGSGCPTPLTCQGLKS